MVKKFCSVARCQHPVLHIRESAVPTSGRLLNKEETNREANWHGNGSE
jgi:hypothetical protein